FASNETWVYTGQVFDADGVFSFAENIDDSAQVAIDGVVVLKNGSAAVVTNSALTGGQNGATASNAANTGTTAVNYGMGPNGDGWHTIEIRLGNATGAAGFTSDATNHWGANSPSTFMGFGFSATGNAAFDGNNFAIPQDPGTAA